MLSKLQIDTKTILTNINRVFLNSYFLFQIILLVDRRSVEHMIISRLIHDVLNNSLYVCATHNLQQKFDEYYELCKYIMNYLEYYKKSILENMCRYEYDLIIGVCINHRLI